MRVEIRNITEKNEVIMWNRETDEIIKKKVPTDVADIYRKELKRVRVIETVLYEDEKETFVIPKGDLAEYKLSNE